MIGLQCARQRVNGNHADAHRSVAIKTNTPIDAGLRSIVGALD